VEFRTTGFSRVSESDRGVLGEVLSCINRVDWIRFCSWTRDDRRSDDSLDSEAEG